MTDAPNTSNAASAEVRMPSYERKERARGGWGPLVLIFVLLIPLAAVGWVAWQQTRLQRELAELRAAHAALQELSASSDTRLAQLQQRQQDLGASLQQELTATLQQQLGATLQQELAAGKAASSAQADRLAQLESGLAAFQRELAETALRANARAAGDAPLAEAEMLLSFAQQRLELARNTGSAIDLLRATDELLRSVEGTAVVAVRETLAQEIAALQAVPVVDVAGLFAQLSAQSARVEKFPAVSAASVQDFTVTPASTEPAGNTDWWTGMKRALGEYFVVTSSTADIEPQLDASAQFQLRALVQLHIEQAKLALIQAEPQLYQAALDAALATARRWLRSSDGSLDDFIAAIEALRNTPITVEIPATGQTLAALRSLSGASSVDARAQAATAAPGATQ